MFVGVLLQARFDVQVLGVYSERYVHARDMMLLGVRLGGSGCDAISHNRDAAMVVGSCLCSFY